MSHKGTKVTKKIKSNSLVKNKEQGQGQGQDFSKGQDKGDFYESLFG